MLFAVLLSRILQPGVTYNSRTKALYPTIEAFLHSVLIYQWRICDKAKHKVKKARKKGERGRVIEEN
jgi:hypothetical protein